MNNYQWSTLKCSDCKTVIAYSPVPFPSLNRKYCALCANAHAQVATWMMPTGNNYGTNGLYGVQNQNRAYKLANDFRRLWDSIFAKLQAHQVAKARNK